MSARQSKVSKARGKLQSMLRQQAPIQNLLQQSLQREHDLIEARAMELTEHFREQADRAQSGRDAEAARADNRLARITVLEGRYHDRKVQHLRAEYNLRIWRNVALGLGVTALIFGGLLGNALL